MPDSKSKWPKPNKYFCFDPGITNRCNLLRMLSIHILPLNSPSANPRGTAQREASLGNPSNRLTVLLCTLCGHVHPQQWQHSIALSVSYLLRLFLQLDLLSGRGPGEATPLRKTLEVCVSFVRNRLLLPISHHHFILGCTVRGSTELRVLSDFWVPRPPHNLPSLRSCAQRLQVRALALDHRNWLGVGIPSYLQPAFLTGGLSRLRSVSKLGKWPLLHFDCRFTFHCHSCVPSEQTHLQSLQAAKNIPDFR